MSFPAQKRDEDARQELNPATRRFLTYIAEQLRGGYSGRFVIDCNRGGISRVEEQRPLSEVDLEGIR